MNYHDLLQALLTLDDDGNPIHTREALDQAEEITKELAHLIETPQVEMKKASSG